jgi:hypothetical protein
MEVQVRIPFLAILALPLASASAAPAPERPAAPVAARSLPAPAAARDCLLPGPTLAQNGQVATRVQKLGELPAANHYLAVVRDVGGCPEPTIVRTGIKD